VYNDPVGSTCTIIAELMQMRQVEIPPEIAGALLGGILSDTLILNLSTTTDRDCKAASFLAKKAKVDIKEFGKSLIQVQADVIKGKTAKEILFSDFREYTIGDKKIGVGQILVVDRKEVSTLKPEIKKEMGRALEEQGFNMIAFTITCPFDEIGEEILVKGEKEIIEKAFGVNVVNDECVVPRIMSRKKDFIPAIAQALTQYEF
jgi:manganese-dependent inorganic pyrophosphatase